MLAASPWFNEGYARYFECDDGGGWGGGVDVTPEWIDGAAAMLPALMKMDYEEFYSGGDRERYIRYQLAWSIAHFIENGTPKIRFRPFRNLKRDYMDALLKTKDMHKATEAAFGGPEKLELFIEEWKRYWKEH
jgi:hypothetical protein